MKLYSIAPSQGITLEVMRNKPKFQIGNEQQIGNYNVN